MSSPASDDVLQAQLGHAPELKRNFSSLSMLGLAFAILNSWTALSASLSLALPSGGPTSVIWGLVTAGVCNLCLAASLAEFLSAWPTAGGQYRKCNFTFLIANEKISKHVISGVRTFFSNLKMIVEIAVS